MSQLNVDTIKKADGTGNLTVPAETGTVVTTASPSLGRRNLIINGAMQVAQRGTSATAGDGYNSVDRISTLARNGTDLTQEQISLSTSDNAYAYGFRKALRYTCVSAYSGGNGYSTIRYILEGQDTHNSGWDHLTSSSNLTVSFWARSSLAGTYYALLRSTSGTVQQYTKEFTLVADTWTKVTFTVSGDSNITINNDNNSGLQLFIATYYGVDYTDAGHTTDVWAAYNGTSQTPVFAQNWRNTAGATFDITGVQLEVGDTATPFEHRSYGEELALCQRYYSKTFNDSVAPAQGATLNGQSLLLGFGISGTQARSVISFPMPMRATPSITFYSTDVANHPATAYWSVYNGTWYEGTATTVDLVGDKAVHANIVIGSSVLALKDSLLTSGYITADAEL